ncbi:MAG: chemotaxis protein CheB [Janthinobacterium lividum]
MRPAPDAKTSQPADLHVPSLHVPGLHVIAIGASAGGLEACSGFLDALPASTGMAFILVQHLDPTHDSLMVELLATHTSLAVVQAAEGMPVERDHLYIIPPAAFLTLADGLLHLRPVPTRRGARLPFDALLQSMARDCGARAGCVVLSGTGADGSAGLLAIKQAGGAVIAQEPGEAGYDGMPRSAIATGAVDAVLHVADIPQWLAEHATQAAPPGPRSHPVEPPDRLPDIIELLRTRTKHDFTPYKPGTLKRRVERRMAMAAIGVHEMDRYVAVLHEDPAELEQLAKDLLIHVTSFFRNPDVFEQVAQTVIPDLINGRPPGSTLRIWVAGCSTGEEAYSMAMLFQEQIAAGSSIRLQIFASDADADAVAVARDGLYPASIQADVTPARLAAFFVKEEQCYRVIPELRAMVVFTVQDLLADPPFSRLDVLSCRNVMIYLGLEAQRRLAALFHFALRPGGVLLLGTSESVGDPAGRFDVISKPARLYRHVGRSRPGDVHFARHAGNALSVTANVAAVTPPSRQAALAELCQWHTLQTHAPATVLATRKHECLYSLGPTERFLRVAPGHVTSDILAMVGEDVRTRLRSAILRAVQDGAPVTVSGGSTLHDGRTLAFSIEVHPIRNEDEELLLIHFVDEPEREVFDAASPADASRVAELERELKGVREELQGAVRSLELSGDEQKEITENALSVNEEFQSTNEELLTSKEELQSLNEELTALNSQLQETLEQQRTQSNDLQNVLYSTDVATLFLDAELKIRFFTPATKALFNVIKTDVGRPLADLHSLSADEALAGDARAVLDTLDPVEREVETPAGVWCRRILPYRTHDGAVEGVVITFTDITARRRSDEALQAARQDAEFANAAKSHFLAAASHDLRQPLQSLALLQGLLASRIKEAVSEKLVARLDDTIGAMSGMLNTLLDINQIEAGIVQPEAVDFSVDTLLLGMKDAFAYQAQAHGLDLRVIPGGLLIHSDPRLLEQMLRNLVSNAIKYTHKGKVLLGCRRSGLAVRIEVWDTGIGIPEAELKSIFEECHQLDNTARQRSRGLGLGLSIVNRLGILLDHRVSVRSRPGLGSVFSVEVPLGHQSPAALPAQSTRDKTAANTHAGQAVHRTGTVLVVEDDPEVRELLSLILSDAGHRTAVVADGPAALHLVEHGSMHPDLLLTDYNLPHRMDGLTLAASLRARLGADLPVILLTGDVSTGALSAIAEQRCLQLNKPVKLAELTQAIQALLPVRATVAPRPRHDPPRLPDGHVIFLVDDDLNIRETIRLLLEDDGRTVQDFATSEAFLAAYAPGADGCLLIDAYLPGMGGLELLQHLRAAHDPLPAIMITGSSDVPMAVQVMKAGAADFIEKPIAVADLLASIDLALERAHDSGKQLAWQASAAKHIAHLTPRQQQIMELVLAGHPSKNIAADLGISQRTVENHRASIMKTTGSKSLPALARLALAASEAVEPAYAAAPGHPT